MHHLLSLRFTLFILDSHICSFNDSSYTTSDITAGRKAVPAEKDQMPDSS